MEWVKTVKESLYRKLAKLAKLFITLTMFGHFDQCFLFSHATLPSSVLYNSCRIILFRSTAGASEVRVGKERKCVYISDTTGAKRKK